jgi:maleate cis-trans isomerase
MAAIPGWEAEFNKPVVTTNQAVVWSMLRRLGGKDRIPGLGKLLEMPV